jgi:hypothetical protein
MFNVQTLVKTGDRPDRPPTGEKFFTPMFGDLYVHIQSFFVLTTGKCIQSVTNSKGIQWNSIMRRLKLF